MKIKVSEPILTVGGQEYKEATVENGVMKEAKSITFGEIVIASMLTAIKDDANETGESMLKKMDIAERFYANKEGAVEITVDEATLIKERIRKVFNSAVFYANAHRIIEKSAKS